MAPFQQWAGIPGSVGSHPRAELEHELATQPAFPRAWIIPGTNIPFAHVNVTRWDEWQNCFLMTAEAHEASPALAGDM